MNLMTMAGSPSFLAETTTTYYQWARLGAFTEWWEWLALVAVCGLLASYVVYFYRRNCVELSRSMAAVLLFLRLAALLGILVFFFQLEKRTERSLVKNSRAILLVDTSQSMSLRDTSAGIASGPSRMEEILKEFTSGTLLEKLRQQHDVVVYRFDQGDVPVEIAALPRATKQVDGKTEFATQQARLESLLLESRWTAAAGGFVVGLGLFLIGIYSLRGLRAAPGERGSWVLLIGMVLSLAGCVALATASLRGIEVGLPAILGLTNLEAQPTDSSSAPGSPDSSATKPIVWDEQLVARGTETRLGDALRYVIDRERGGPIGAVVVLSDGNNNSGLELAEAIRKASSAQIAVFAIGIGSDKLPSNAQVVDLEAPQRVFPGDKFTLTGYLKGQNLPQKSVTVDLFSSAADGSAEVKEDSQLVDLDESGKIRIVTFTTTPSEQGTRLYKLRLVPIPGEIDQKDNEKTTKVEILKRKTKVLLLASGPTREFIFLRNQLFRDKETIVDVWLQSGRPGISQDANEILTKFPEVADELFAYDCIVAFDPDWEKLDELQIKTLERFVAEKAGGLIVVAGPVFTPQWSSRRRGDAKVDLIKALYPVVFYYQNSASLSVGRFAADKAWPLTFSREGKEAEFLRLDDDAARSQQIWQQFEGVYGYYAVKDPKAGARVLARFSDPDTKIDDELPIYLATQFYGAGRVFFQASGEMWRLRALDDTHFEQYYTKLIRWASEGRLLRDSSRGLLLIDKERCTVGDQIAVRAILQDGQHRPLELPEVGAVVIGPDGKRAPLDMKRVKDGARDGMFAESFTATLEGDYRIELQVPGAADQLLVQEVRAKTPAAETESPQRNDSALLKLTQQTGGRYYIGLPSATNEGAGGQPSLAKAIVPQDQVSLLPGTPDRAFEKLLMTWLIGFICGILCLEWLLRRLNKLA